VAAAKRLQAKMAAAWRENVAAAAALA